MVRVFKSIQDFYKKSYLIVYAGVRKNILKGQFTRKTEFWRHSNRTAAIDFESLFSTMQLMAGIYQNSDVSIHKCELDFVQNWICC